MEAEALVHLERIEALLAGLAALPWIRSGEIGQIRQDLVDFDAAYWPLVRVLSLPLYRELTELLTCGEAASLLPERPHLAVVMPLHHACPALLRQALHSLRRQVGVRIEGWISIDGEAQDQQLAQAVLSELDAGPVGPPWTVSLLVSPRNRGVGPCRNRALRQITAPFFTCLDADDVFHPLRCLHALLVLLREGLMRLNTGWCRASLLERKLVLINDRLAHVGHNSFVARSELLQQCGYQADLRVFEDTEFMLRHRFYGVAMKDSPIVSHYLHTEPKPDYVSLASPCRLEVHAIEDHPYLCGSVIAAQPPGWLALECQYRERYQSLAREELLQAFPGALDGDFPAVAVS